MIVKFGMMFQDSAPDFGSIEKRDNKSFILLSADISKLNSALTKSGCLPLMKSGSAFTVNSGTTAIVLDKPAVYMYHSGTDTWYEVIPVEEDD